jgi:diguanylate cyclase (GGDEF)-like protein
MPIVSLLTTRERPQLRMCSWTWMGFVGQSDTVRQLSVVCDAGWALTSTLELERLLPLIAQRIAEAVHASGCDLYEYRPSDGPVVVASWSRESRGNGSRGEYLSIAAGYARLLDGGRMRDCQLGDAGLPVEVAEAMSRLGDDRVLGVPLSHEEHAIGGLVVRFGRNGDAGVLRDDELLESLAVSASVAMHNARLFEGLEERNRRLSSLLESTRAISSAVGLEDVLATVARTAANALQCARCEIYEHDAEDDAIVLLAEHTPGGTYSGEATAPGQRFSLKELPGDRVILGGRTPVVEHASDPSVHPATREYMERWGEKTYLSVPLVFAGDVLGLLLFIETEERFFTDDDIDLARALGEQASVTLHNARHVRALQVASGAMERQLRDRHELLRLSQTLLTTLDQEVVFEQIAMLLNALVGYDALDVAIVHPETNELVFEFSMDSEDDRTLGFRLTLGEGVVGAIALSGAPEMVNDMTTDPRGVRVPGTIQRPQASILAPLKVGGVVTGVLNIDRFGGRIFEDREFELVQLVTNLAAIALRNAQLYGEMQSQAATDALTGLLNRRGLDERLEDELSRARRWDRPVSVLMIDIDDFKPFNDRFGHPRGDMLLKRLSAVLKRSTREGIDVVARYGGEEFVVVLPDTAPVGAGLAADRLRANVEGGRRSAASVAESIRAAMADESVARSGQTPVGVTVSVGVACYPDHGEAADRVLANADKALYLAKGLGKNRVEIYR